ncbi:sensor histidine kinase [Streptomyces sp. NPDC090025]|uniref:sensor histidine kinase n=1 Tax=Streptomyces sp. NPDC090025 TaxID=3365922 RepID=UPI0038333AC8
MPPRNPGSSSAVPAPDLFERCYLALLRPLARAPRWTRGDVLLAGLLAADGVCVAVLRDPGLLHRVFPAMAIALLVAASFLERRRAPLAVAALSLLGLALDGTRIAVYFAFYSLAKYQGRHRLAAIVGCWAAYLPLSWIVPGRLGDSWVQNFLISSVLLIVPLVCGLGANAYERTQTALRAEREQRIARVKAEVKTEERMRLAREMHDILGHRIAITAMHAGAIEMVQGVRPQSKELARAIGDTARTAMGDLRQVLGALRGGDDSVIAGRRLADLDTLVEQVRESGLDVVLCRDRASGEDGASGVPEEIALTVYRAVQESLTNVLKHAPGATAEASVEVRADAVVARVTNTAPRSAPRPGPPAPGGGFGLVGLRERATLLGGTVEAGPTARGGWEVGLTLPARSGRPLEAVHKS